MPSPHNNDKDISSNEKKSLARKLRSLFSPSKNSSSKTSKQTADALRLTSHSTTSLHSFHPLDHSDDIRIRGWSLDLSRSSTDLSRPDFYDHHDVPVTIQELGQLKAKMAFNFANASSGVTVGEIEEVQTEQLGFLSLGGETRLNLLPSPWPTDNLPSSTSSLLTVAQSKRVLAAASPDSIVITSTDDVRNALTNASAAQNFQPKTTIPVPRLSQLIFTSDDSYLVAAAETGGGLAVYSTDAIMQGNKQSAFQISTESQAVRAIAPNPATENAHVIAVILAGGQLMLADLSSKQFTAGGNGSKVIRENVSCVAWSVKGKQLVAGLADGTCVQLEVTGNVKATFPSPPGLDGPHHVSTIQWLANDEFLLFYTPNNADPDSAPESTVFFLKTNAPRTSWQFSKVPMDPAPPFGMNRQPPTHFVSRLRNWHHLLDTLIVSSVASGDIGLLTKSDVPLTSEGDAAQITNIYTSTSFTVDSRKAVMPLSSGDDLGDTSPIGMVVDLTSNQPVPKPIPGDEMEDSPFPLPAIVILNNEGRLIAWWFVYNKALQERVPYPMDAAQGAAVSASPAPAKTIGAFGSSTAASPFGSNVFGQSTASPAASSGFAALGAGQSTSSAFGTGAGLGNKTSAWGTPTAKTSIPAATGSVFGQSTSGGSAFGQSGFGGIASKTSAWGTPSTSTPAATTLSAPAFGASAFGASTPSSNGFGGVGGLGQNKSPWSTAAALSSSSAPTGEAAGGSNPFAKFASGSPSAFGGSATTSSPFGQQSKPAQSAFATGGASFGTSSFGLTPQPSFGSTVTLDSNTSGESRSVFGTPSQSTSVFAKAAPASNTTPNAFTNAQISADSADDDMMDDESEEEEEEEVERPKVADSKPVSSLFGSSKASESKPTSSLFGNSPGGFKLQSSFKPDNKDDEVEKPGEKPAAKSLFGGDFGAALSLGDSVDKQKASPSPFSFSTGTAPSATKPSLGTTDTQELPEPPQVTSKPIASPVTVTTSSSKPPSEEEDLPPLGGESPVAISMPNSPGSLSGSDAASDEDDGDDEDDEQGVEATPRSAEKEPTPAQALQPAKKSGTDAPLPPNPYKAAKPTWFSQPPPGAAPEPTSEVKVKEEPRDDAPPPLPPNPMKVARPSWFNEAPPGAATEAPLQPPATTPSGPRTTLFGEITNTPATVISSNHPGKLPVPLFGSTPSRSPMPPAPTPPISSPLFKTSTTPFGLPAPPVTFPPPNMSVRESPRSPSPIRQSSTPYLGSTDITKNAPALGQQREHPPAVVTPRVEQPQPVAEDFVDDEDTRIRDLLESKIEPSTELAPFVAHQDYTGSSDMPGVSGHCERVYRDINSMLDTLGLNARSLSSFITGQQERLEGDDGEDVERELEDLDEPESWTLIEAPHLEEIQVHLGDDVDANKLQNVPNTLANLSGLRKELLKTRKDLLKVKLFLEQDRDPEHRAQVVNAKLDPLHASKQRELRASLSTFQSRLVAAEDAMLNLRTKIASHADANGMATGAAGATPTYEAIENTIRKIIRMTQERSSEIDVLEAQMRKMGLAPSSMSASFSSSRGGRDSTPPHSAFRDSMRMSLNQSQSLNRSAFAANGGPSTPNGRASVRDSPSRQALLSSARQAAAARTQAVVPRRGYSASVGSSDDDEDDEDFHEAKAHPLEKDPRMQRFLAESKRRKAVLERVREGLLKKGIKKEIP